MTATTNQLVATLKKVAIPASFVGVATLGIALFLNTSGVHAASAFTALPLDDHSVSALTALDQAMESVASRVIPAVVNISVTARNQDRLAAQDGQDLPPGFSQFFGQGAPQQPQFEHGIGSGVIVSPDGYIVTNNHVIDGATQIKVTLNDRRILTGKLIGVDKLTDLAVIKINATGLASIAWGDSSQLHPGQTVLAFGSPFGYFQFSVTRGIVSAVDRPNPYSDDARKPGGFIQTDAAINPGNSGGALVNSHGELVGINTFIISNSGSFAGAGFAIPSQMVRTVAEQLMKNGKIEHGYLGINLNDVTPDNAKFFNLQDPSGAIVAQVTPDSPASRGGLQRGDVIKRINGHEIANGSSLQLAVSQLAPGANASLGILRDGKSLTVDIKVGQFNKNADVADNNGDGSPNNGKLGLAVSDLTEEARQQIKAPDQLKGAMIQNVRPGSPAEDAGLQPGDVILEVDRKPTTSASDFVGKVHATESGKDLLLLVWSKGNASYRTIHPDSQNG